MERKTEEMSWEDIKAMSAIKNTLRMGRNNEPDGE
jgi:hypothetical protein